jgi:hypothetical protein
LIAYFFAQKRGFKMLLTKKYFRKFQFLIVGASVFCAVIVSVLNTGFIIFSLGKKPEANKKETKKPVRKKETKKSDVKLK